MSGTATAGARPRNSIDVRSEGETKRGADRRAARLRDFPSAIARAANLRRVVASVVYPQSRVPSSDRARRATAVMHAAHASSGLGLGLGLGLVARASAFAGSSSRPDPRRLRPPAAPRPSSSPPARRRAATRASPGGTEVQRREDDKMLDGVEAKAAALKESKAAKRAAKEAKADAPKRDPTLKYSKRGKVSSQPGQVSKAAPRVREATAAKQAEGAISAERAAEKREEPQGPGSGHPAGRHRPHAQAHHDLQRRPAADGLRHRPGVLRPQGHRQGGRRAVAVFRPPRRRSGARSWESRTAC